MGKLLMIGSAMFLIAAAYTSLIYERANQQAWALREYYIWPYKWLSLPLTIVGISLFLTGLFIGYYDDISQIF